MNPSRESLQRLLESGIQELDIPLNDEVIEKILRYREMLEKWNRAYNLTAVRDPEEQVVKHLLDSLAVLPLIRGERFVDVGAGAGLPGIPLAIARPDLHFTQIDSAGKKARFMVQAARELGLGNVEVHHCRVEAYEPETLFDGVLSRAFASLADMIEVAGHLCAEDGRLFAMKGQRPGEELAALPEGWKLERIDSITVPGLDAERCLVVLARS